MESDGRGSSRFAAVVVAAGNFSRGRPGDAVDYELVWNGFRASEGTQRRNIQDAASIDSRRAAVGIVSGQRHGSTTGDRQGSRPRYGRGNRNALADLRALEYLMCCFAMFPEKPTQFWTRDKALVWFWCGMQASKFEYDGNAARFNLSPKPELFPGWAFHELPKIWEAGY